MNDFWELDYNSNEWKWIEGNKEPNKRGIYNY